MKSFGAFLLCWWIVSPATAQSLASGADRRQAFHHYRAGQEFLSAERYQQAVTEFQTAVRFDRFLTDAHYGLGQAFMGLRRYVSAAQAFEDCIEAASTLHGLREKDRVLTDRQIDDEIREVQDTIRRIQSQGGRGPLKATQLENRLQDLHRSRSSLGKPFEAPAAVLLALGSAYFRNDDRARAGHYWLEAVKVNSKLGEGWNNLAVIYLGEGRKDDAEAAVRNAERAGFRVNPRLKEDIKALR